MRTSCISHPRSAPLIIIHQWKSDLFQGDATAAALLSFFEYWHGVKLSTAENSGGLSDPLAFIQHHTRPGLEAGLLGIAKRKAISAAILKLERMGLIKVVPNPYRSSDRTGHFIFNADLAQDFANDWGNAYQDHRRSPFAKYPVCIAPTLAAPAIGQKGFSQSAKRDDAIGQKASSNRPKGLDPKTTSKTTNEDFLDPLKSPKPDANTIQPQKRKPIDRWSAQFENRKTTRKDSPFDIAWTAYERNCLAVGRHPGSRPKAAMAWEERFPYGPTEEFLTQLDVFWQQQKIKFANGEKCVDVPGFHTFIVEPERGQRAIARQQLLAQAPQIADPKTFAEATKAKAEDDMWAAIKAKGGAA